MTKMIITAAPPNPNGDLHIGHLSGPFLGADVMARYLRSRGHDVVHVGYIDEHSCYVPRRAKELGHPTRAVAHYLGSQIEQTLAAANMSPDFCGRPHRDAWHDETVQDFFTQLRDKGALTVRTLPVLRCPQEGTYLYEAEIRGTCHFCGAPSDGFYCEECGRPQTSGQLRDGRCTSCGSVPVADAHERIVFPLEEYRSALTEHYRDRPVRPRLRRYLDMMLAEPLPDTPISRIGDYGVAVPLPGWEGHYLDTWFSGIWGYVAGTSGAQRVAGQGPGVSGWYSPDTQVHEFIGFDCSFSHALLWPAMCAALGVNLPTSVVTNEFYRLEGGKFSTSRWHAVWGADILSEVPADSLRFYLCLTGPEQEQTNFVRAQFRQVVQEVLVDGLDGLVDRAARRLAAAGDDGTPSGDDGTPSGDDGTPSGDVAATALTGLADGLSRRVGSCLEPEGFSPAAAAEQIRAFSVDQADEVAAAIEEAGVPELRRFVTTVAATIEPIMPGWAFDLLTDLGQAPTTVPALRLRPGVSSGASSGVGSGRRDLAGGPLPRRDLYVPGPGNDV